MNYINALKFTSSTAYDLLFSLARINCNEMFNKSYSYPRYQEKLKPDEELGLWVEEQRVNFPEWLKELLNRFFNCETFFGASTMIYIENNELQDAKSFIEFLKDLPPKQILKYFLYSGYGPEIEKDENITIEEIVDRLTTDEKETLIFITQRMIHSPSEKANLLEFFEDPEKMKEEYIQLLEWYYENIFSSVEEDIRKLNEEKLKELKKRIPDVREKTLEKLSLSSSDIVKKSDIFIGVSYYLGIMAASATLSLDKKGYVFVVGYDRMEFMDIEETQTVSCAEVFGSLGHPQRILIVKELLKGETTITKLAKKLKLTTKEVKEHLSELERSGIINSEIESEMVHKLNCDREAIKEKIQAALDKLLSSE